MSLTKSSVKNASVQSVAVILQSLLQLLSVTILARLLLPVDFGIAAVGTSIIAVATMLSEIGLGSAIVQKDSISQSYISTSFFISILLYFIICATLYFMAPSIANFNDNQELIAIVHFLILPFFVTGMTSIPKGVLLRRLEYKKLMLVNVISVGFGMVFVASILALLQYGVWAILWGQLIVALISFIMAWYYAKVRINFLFDSNSLRQIFRFGGGITLSRFFNYLAVEGDKLVLGHTLSLSLLGVFERIYKIASMLSSQIGNVFDMVLFPTFSKIQKDNSKMRVGYVKSMELACITGCLIGFTAPLFSKEIIMILLGSQWIEYSQIFMVLLSLPAIRLLTRVGDALLRSIAKVYTSAIIKLFAAIITLGGMFLCRNYGLLGVSVVYFISSLFSTIIIHLILINKFEVNLKELLIVLINRVLIIALLLMPLWLIHYAFYDPVVNLVDLIIKLSYLMGLMICIIFYFPRLLGNTFYEIVNLIRQKF